METPVIFSEDERLGLPSASSAEAEILCLGRRNLCAKYGIDKVESQSAKRGTKIHAVLEGEEGYDSLNSSDKKTHDLICLYEGALVEKYSCEGAPVSSELRLWVKDEMEDNQLYSAKLDRIYVRDNFALAIDFKTGFSNVTKARDNWQLRIQAICTFANYPQVQEVASALIHPHHPFGKYSDYVFTRKEAGFLKEEYESYLEKMKDENAQRTPNDISCKYCSAKDTCPERNSALTRIDTSLKGWKPFIDCTPKEREERLKLYELAKDIIKQDEATAKSLLKDDPRSVDGYALSKGKTSRELVSPSVVFDTIASVFGNNVANQSFTISIAKVEEGVQESCGYSKDEAKAVVEKELGQWIKKKVGEPSLKKV
jgi:hypothetical protein